MWKGKHESLQKYYKRGVRKYTIYIQEAMHSGIDIMRFILFCFTKRFQITSFPWKNGSFHTAIFHNFKLHHHIENTPKLPRHQQATSDINQMNDK